MPMENCIKCGSRFWSDGGFDWTCSNCLGQSTRENRQYWQNNRAEYSYEPNYPQHERVEEIYSSSATGKSVSGEIITNVFKANVDGLKPCGRSQEPQFYPPVPERTNRTLQRQFEKDYPDKNVENIYVSVNEYNAGVFDRQGLFRGEDVFDSWDLDLREYKKLKSFRFMESYLTSINLSECRELTELNLNDNNLTSADFLNQLPNPEKLETLWVHNNNIQPTDISIFSKFINLKWLRAGLQRHALRDGKRNQFYGSLKAFQNSTKLTSLCVEATDVDEGLEYLPKLNIDCSSLDTNAKVKKIQDQLRKFNYDIEAWQLAHPHKMYEVRPEYFTQEDSKEKWLKALEDKLENTQRKLNQTKQYEPEKTKRIERLESKVKLLKEIKVKVEDEKKNDELMSQIEINPKN